MLIVSLFPLFSLFPHFSFPQLFARLRLLIRQGIPLVSRRLAVWKRVRSATRQPFAWDVSRPLLANLLSCLSHLMVHGIGLLRTSIGKLVTSRFLWTAMT